jgi:hypothetical protein
MVVNESSGNLIHFSNIVILDYSCVYLYIGKSDIAAYFEVVDSLPSSMLQRRLSTMVQDVRVLHNELFAGHVRSVSPPIVL